MAIDKDKLEISKEKDKQEQLQKIKEDADLWEERRNKLKDKSMEIAADPQAWLKGFLMKKAMEAGHYAISKKRRLEVAASKEKEVAIDIKNNSDKLKTAVELKKLEIEPSEIKFGFEAKQLKLMVETLKAVELNTRGFVETISNTLVSNNISSTNNSKEMVETISNTLVSNNISSTNNFKEMVETISNTLVSNNISSTNNFKEMVETINQVVLVNTAQLKQDSKQFKADNRTSAAEEAAAAGVAGSKTDNGLTTNKKDKNKPGIEAGAGGIMSTIRGAITESDGLKGILKNIMMEFGKAGKFLMSLGARFLLPLVATPAGWTVLAGLAVGGLVFSYWDDIVLFMSDIFKSVKSTFSKVISKISGMFSSIGDTIKEILEFFNPIALAKTLAKAIFPAKYYDAVTSFFGSEDTDQEKTTPKPYKMGTNDTVLDDMPKPAIESRGSWGKKSSSIPSIKPNENLVIRKDEMVSGALQKGMDNNISQGSGNWGKKSSDTNIVAPTVNNNSTNIRQEKTHDTDITNLNLNASAVIGPNQSW